VFTRLCAHIFQDEVIKLTVSSFTFTGWSGAVYWIRITAALWVDDVLTFPVPEWSDPEWFEDGIGHKAIAINNNDEILITAGGEESGFYIWENWELTTRDIRLIYVKLR
jgi:hypothetical protein